MTHFRTPRFWLLTTAALVFGSHMTATAQTANSSGVPTMVAAAPGLPSIPAEQIARDVTSEYNPRTGMRELVAAPFDPFEEDPALAGSLRLRSADGAIAIDGQPLRDGALVEMDFYYNSVSNDPFGGRNYSDVSFVNGELAPVTLRDTRILECSTRVENVVYDHNTYYDRGYSLGIYRPYRHYSGHYGFGFGFGNRYFGPGYGYYGRRGYYRDRGYHRDRGHHRSRGSTHSRVLDAVRNRDRDRADGRRDRNEIRGERGRDRDNDRVRAPRGNSRNLSDRQIEDRTRRIQSYGTGRTRSDARRNARGSGPMRAGNTQPRIELASPPPQSSTPRADTRRAQPRSNAERRRDLTRSEPRRAEPRRNESRRSETRRSEPRRESNSRPKKVKSTTPRRISGGGVKQRMREKMNFFPNDGFGGRSVVSSRSVDCAREDKLRVFIPNERLDAARFDGLTLIALDAQGGETPIYLPPNYIEGYRLAASGQVTPQGIGTVSQIAPPPVSPLRTTIEPAPCPAGTSAQTDGTCLQIGTVGYPAR